MSSFPLAALSVKPPETTGPLDQYEKVMGFRELMQRQALQQQQIQGATQENQLREMQLQDQTGIRKALVDSKGDWAKLEGLVSDPQYGISPNGQFQVKQQHLTLQKQVSETQGAQFDAQQKMHSAVIGHLQPTIDLDDGTPEGQAKAQQRWTAGLNDLVGQGMMTQEEAAPHAQYPGKDDATLYLNGLKLNDQAFQEEAGRKQKAAELAKTNAETTEAGAKTAEANANTAKTNLEVNAQTSGNPINQAQAESKYRNILMNQKLNRPVSAEDKAYVAAYEKDKTLVPQATINLQGNLLSAPAKDMAAENYFQTGNLPAGMRSPAMVAAIIGRAAELHPNASGELAGNRAAYEANKKSYDNVTGTLDTLSAFEQSGLKNLKQFTDLTAKLPDTGLPWLNTPVRNLDKNAVGAEWLPAVDAAKSVALREIARVTNDPKLSGSLTDSARGEVENLVPANATLPQIVRVVKVLQQDMANVHSSLASQKQDIGTRLGIKATSTQAGPAANNKIRVKLADGRTGTIDEKDFDSSMTKIQ